jgi:hypothetical protein
MLAQARPFERRGAGFEEWGRDFGQQGRHSSKDTCLGSAMIYQFPVAQFSVASFQWSLKRNR